MDNNPQKTSNQGGVGPIVSSIIVIVVVVIGGIYFWGSKMTKDKQAKDVQSEKMKDFQDVDLIGSDIDADILSIPKEDLGNFEEELLSL